MSHPAIILTKVREALRPGYKDFIAKHMTKVKTIQKGGKSVESISYEDFKNLLNELLCEAIVEHEIVTLCRHFGIDTKESPRSRRDTVRSIVQTEIFKGLWDDVERTVEFIYHLSPENTTFLSERKMMTTIRACRIPLDTMIVQELLEVLNRNECNEIEVCDFLSFVDIKKCVAPPVDPFNPKVNFLLSCMNSAGIIFKMTTQKLK